MNSLKQTLLAKLRRPIHISFISKHLVKLPMSDTIDIINEMVQEDLIEESKYGKGYYVVKSIK
jgi:hypothetical protein